MAGQGQEQVELVAGQRALLGVDADGPGIDIDLQLPEGCLRSLGKYSKNK